MNMQEESFNALVEFVKSFPGVDFVGSHFGDPIGPWIATGKPWAEVLRKEVMARFPECEECKSIEISMNS